MITKAESDLKCGKLPPKAEGLAAMQCTNDHQ